MRDIRDLEELVRRTDDAGLRCAGPAGPLHLAAAALWARGRSILRPIQASIDVGTFVGARGSKESRTDAAEHTECSFYTPALELQEDWLVDRLPVEMEVREPIFVSLDLAQYSVEESERTGRNVEDSMHGTALLIWPTEQNRWHVYHCNPHGRASRDVTEHESYRTRTRVRRTQLETPLDSIIVGTIVERLRERVTGVSVTYEWGDQAHNFYGPNLQIADDLGMCFAHVFLMFYNLGCGPHGHSTQLRAHGSIRRFPPARRLLARGSFSQAVILSALADAAPVAALRALDGDIDGAEELVYEAGGALIARILQSVIRAAVPVLCKEAHAHAVVLEEGATPEALASLLAVGGEDLAGTNNAGVHGQER